jgi:hypothetical protein
MAAPYKYEVTVRSVMEWANSELEHVGRIAACKDKRIQYAYALSTVNGMAHLKDALFEIVNDDRYSHSREDLLRTHNSVIRVMKHLIKDYNISLNTIRAFNTKGVLSDLSYLKTRKKRSTRKRR